MNDIKVGDLVMIVRSHCPHRSLGVVYTVQDLGMGEGRCSTCDYLIGSVRYAIGMPYITPLSWLKRIPPLSELEETTTSDHMDIKV